MTRRCVILLIITFLILPSLRMCASPQLPNYIIFRGDTIATYNLMLELYFQNQGTTDHGKLFGLSFRDGASLNCWRVYQAFYEFDNDTLFLADIISCGEDAKVSKVIMPEYPIQDSIDKYWYKDEYNYCINNVFKALQKLTFDIIKDKGKPISEDVYFEIWFDSRRKIENWTR